MKGENLTKFVQAKEDVIENLEAVQLNLNRCLEEGLKDEGDAFYNEVLGLLDEAHIADTWEELSEAISKGKTLEIDIAAWMAFHGRTTVSLPWPKI